MAHLKKYGLVFGLVLSLALNGLFYFQLQGTNQKLRETNSMISAQVEKGLRQSMAYVAELRNTSSSQSLQGLQRTMQDLTVAFRHWLELNQTERNPNQPMQAAVTSLEALRNGMVYHLNNQYAIHDQQLGEADFVFLERAQESLNNLLNVYDSLKGEVGQLKEPGANDYGMTTAAQKMEEVARLYRHSATPNQHPAYISSEEAFKAAEEAYPLLQQAELKSDEVLLQMKEGVHYYSLPYYIGRDLAYVVWVDGIYGTIRNFEDKQIGQAGSRISERQAINRAQAFIEDHYDGELLTEMCLIPVEGKPNDPVYAFRFTPIRDGIKYVSDAFSVNLASDGTVIKFSSDFENSPLPPFLSMKSPEEVAEQNAEVFTNLHYDGISVIRVFQTHYEPQAVYTFKTTQNEQQVTVFFDRNTGKQLYQMYYIYEALKEGSFDLVPEPRN